MSLFPKKYILLDIDGVLVKAAGWKPVEIREDGFFIFNATSQKCLDYLLQESGADIILTTSHRARYDNAKWHEMFKSRVPHLRNISTLNDYDLHLDSGNRYTEILAWANRFGNGSRYAILDDDTSLNLLPDEIKKHWIKTVSLIGLTQELAQEALLVLNNL